MPAPHLRAADADRTAVAGQLGAHMAAGRLGLEEYEERVARAYASRTHGELDQLTADLPPLPATPPAAAPSPTGVEPAGSHRRNLPAPNGWRAGEWASWLSTSVIVVGIWLITSLASGDWLYPWPIWVIGPWGLVLAAQALTGRPDDPGSGRQLPS